MSDLISRQDAIDMAKKLLDYYGTNDISKEFADHTAERFMNWVPSAQQWTPCSEGLPDEDFWSSRGRQFSDHVLVTIVNHANDDELFTDMAQTVDGIWQLSHDVDGDCSLPNWCEVIAWMPQPEPYKGEE